MGKEFSVLHSIKPGSGDHLNFSASGLPTRNMCVEKLCLSQNFRGTAVR